METSTRALDLTSTTALEEPKQSTLEGTSPVTSISDKNTKICHFHDDTALVKLAAHSLCSTSKGAVLVT